MISMFFYSNQDGQCKIGEWSIKQYVRQNRFLSFTVTTTIIITITNINDQSPKTIPCFIISETHLFSPLQPFTRWVYYTSMALMLVCLISMVSFILNCDHRFHESIFRRVAKACEGKLPQTSFSSPSSLVTRSIRIYMYI